MSVGLRGKKTIYVILFSIIGDIQATTAYINRKEVRHYIRDRLLPANTCRVNMLRRIALLVAADRRSLDLV